MLVLNINHLVIYLNHDVNVIFYLYLFVILDVLMILYYVSIDIVLDNNYEYILLYYEDVLDYILILLDHF